MATETAPPINGNYASQHSYNPAGHSNATHAPNHAAVMNGNGSGHGNAAADNHSSSGNGDSNGVSKDEVGWYFVEQYYTTLSRNPEKLHVRSIPSKPYFLVFELTSLTASKAILLQALSIRVWRGS